jgi:hypothetical protein
MNTEDLIKTKRDTTDYTEACESARHLSINDNYNDYVVLADPEGGFYAQTFYNWLVELDNPEEFIIQFRDGEIIY